MKYLLLIVLLAVVFYKLTGRRNARPSEPPPVAPPPEAMQACAQCGVHLPASEDFPGRGDSFCSAAHRAAFEARQEKRA